MHPLEVYYVNDSGRGLTHPGGIGPVYSAPRYLQHGHGMCNFFGRLFLWVGPLQWLGIKAVGRETLRTGGKILTDIVENNSPEVRISCLNT
jgi:hypothetical protein